MANEKEVQIKISGKVDSSLNMVSQKVDKAFSKMTKIAKSATNALGSAASDVIRGSLEVGSSFESQMSTVQAISGATEKQITQLEEKAKEMGATTQFTATESGQAMEYMAMAGWKTKDMLNGIGGIMDLAAASGEDLAGTSDIVTDALTAFNLKAKDAAHFSDVLAQAASNSNTNVSMMGETFKYVAPIAGALDYSAEDTAVSIGLMANAGIKASQSGTELRRIMSNTADGITLVSKAYAKAGKKTGKYKIETANADGSMKDWSQTVEVLREQFSKMTEEEQAMNAESIAGKTAMSGLLAIVNASDKDYEKLTNSIDNASGAAERMAKVRLDNLQGDVTIFQSALEGKGIELYDEIKEPMREIVQSATDWLEEIDVARVVDDFKDFGSAVLDFAEPLLEVGEWMMNHPDVLSGTVTGISSAITGGKLLTTLPKVQKSFGDFTKLLVAHPWVAGGALAVSVITGIGVAATKAQKMAAEASLDRHFGDIALSMDQIQDAADNIIGSKKLEAVGELLSSIKVSDELVNDMDKAIKNINKVDWKLSVGLDLSEDDKAKYEENVKEYVSNAQDLIEQKGYSVTLATNVLFDDDASASEITNMNNAFYKEMDEKAGKLAKQINKKLKKAMKNGLTDSLRNEIDGLLSQLSEITNALTEAENEASWQMLETEFSGKDLDADSFERLQKKVNENINKINEGADSAYQTNMSNLNAQKNMGKLSDEEYEKQSEIHKGAYYKTQADAINQGSEFIYNTLMDTYGDAIAKGTMTSSDWNALNSLVSSSDFFDKMQELEKQAKANGFALSDDLKKYPVMLENIKKASSGYDWRDNLKEVVFGVDPVEVAEHNAAGQILKEQAKDRTQKDLISIFGLFGSKDVDFSDLIPKSAKEEAARGGKESGQEFEQNFRNKAKEGLSSGITSNMPITLNPSVTVIGATTKGEQKSGNKSPLIYPPIPGHAEGIISTKAHIAAVSEGNKPEAIIPINSSARSRRLYEATGKLMGYNKTSSQGVTFAPNINITLTGKASAEDKNEIRNLVQKELDKQYKKMIRDNKRFNMRQ